MSEDPFISYLNSMTKDIVEINDNNISRIYSLSSKITLNNCLNLIQITANNATELTVNNCPKLISIIAPNATVKYTNCPNLKTINAKYH